MKEDMTIPVIIKGPAFSKNTDLGAISIKDIAPTVSKLLNVSSAKEWEGTPLF